MSTRTDHPTATNRTRQEEPDLSPAQAARARSSHTKKILIHAINFAPELIGCAKYTTQLALHLDAQGHDVEVVTTPPHYPGWFVRAPYRRDAYRREMLGAIRLTRCPMIMKEGASGVWRLLAPLSFAVTSAPIVAWRILRLQPDVVLCVEPTLFSTPIALFAAKCVGARCVLHVQDLEVDAAFELGHLRGDALRRIGIALEARLLRGFSRIVAISHKMRDALLAKGLPSEQVVVLRNWVDLEAIAPRPRSAPNEFRTQLGFSQADFIILYAGHIGVKQSLDIVLKAARRLVTHSSIRFVIAGDGPALAGLRDSFADLVDLVFLPLQPTERFCELLAMADLHVLPQHPSAADLVLPSKLGGMLASGRPIIATAASGTELANLLTDIALLSPPGDDDALAQTILNARSRDLSGEVARGLALAETLSTTRLLPAFERLLFDKGAEGAATASYAALEAEH